MADVVLKLEGLVQTLKQGTHVGLKIQSVFDLSICFDQTSNMSFRCVSWSNNFIQTQVVHAWTATNLLHWIPLVQATNDS